MLFCQDLEPACSSRRQKKTTCTVSWLNSSAPITRYEANNHNLCRTISRWMSLDFIHHNSQQLILWKSLIVSSGYYGFDFVTPTPPPTQCVERFHRYRSSKKNIIASLLKFAGYIHSHKILPGNIFGLILKNKMAATGIFRL